VDDARDARSPALARARMSDASPRRRFRRMRCAHARTRAAPTHVRAHTHAHARRRRTRAVGRSSTRRRRERVARDVGVAHGRVVCETVERGRDERDVAAALAPGTGRGAGAVDFKALDERGDAERERDADGGRRWEHGATRVVRDVRGGR